MPDLKKLLEELLKNEIDFVLVGGLAATVHGSTLVTQDIDICAAITDEQVAKLRGTLQNFHPTLRMNPQAKISFMDHPKSLDGVKNIYLQTDLGILDIMSSVPPAGDFKEIKSRAVKLTLYGYPCWVISIEDLIAIKKTMNRPKDQQAVKELLIVQKQNNAES